MEKVKSKRRGTCYLCGKEGIMTDDHVPPRCLAPRANNSKFYKLPACETCNKALTVQEGPIPLKSNRLAQHVKMSPTLDGTRGISWL
jgi:hypothetical protein